MAKNKNDIVTFLERKYLQSNKYQTKKSNSIEFGSDMILEQDLAGQRLEQENLYSMNADFVELGLYVYELQKQIQKLQANEKEQKGDVKHLKKSVDGLVQLVSKNSLEVDSISKEVHMMRKKVKHLKNVQKQMKKIIRWFGVFLQVNNASDELDVIHKKCTKELNRKSYKKLPMKSEYHETDFIDASFK